jgi:hypothetical protein
MQCGGWWGGAEIGDRGIRRRMNQNWRNLPCRRRWCQTALFELRAHCHIAAINFIANEGEFVCDIHAHITRSALPEWEIDVTEGIDAEIEWVASVKIGGAVGV